MSSTGGLKIGSGSPPHHSVQSFTCVKFIVYIKSVCIRVHFWVKNASSSWQSSWKTIQRERERD